jgi:thiamine biosynthesis lipoprotein
MKEFWTGVHSKIFGIRKSRRWRCNVWRVSLFSAVTLLLVVMVCGCSIGKSMHTSSLFAMNTIMELEADCDDEVITGAEDMIRTLEKELSVTDKDSEIARLNDTGQAQLSEDVADIMKRALDLCDETGGALDISIYPVLRTWGFTTGEYRVPEDVEIEELLQNVDYSKVELTGNAVSLQEGMQVDLGSVVKGYTGTAVADYFKKEGVSSALINLGGNVQCIGTKLNGEKWKVAIKSPFSDSSSGILGVITVQDEAIITSGGYERFFEEDGEVYWHILDPSTGRPAKSGLASVTIIGQDGLKCDGLSTALFVMGLDGAIDFWKSSDNFDAVLVTEEGEVYVTEGVAADFSLTPEYRDAELTVVRR